MKLLKMRLTRSHCLGMRRNACEDARWGARMNVPYRKNNWTKQTPHTDTFSGERQPCNMMLLNLKEDVRRMVERVDAAEMRARMKLWRVHCHALRCARAPGIRAPARACLDAYVRVHLSCVR